MARCIQASAAPAGEKQRACSWTEILQPSKARTILAGIPRDNPRIEPLFPPTLQTLALDRP